MTCQKNSEYEEAKDEQVVEGQISSLETKIRYAEIVTLMRLLKMKLLMGKQSPFKKLVKTTKKYISSPAVQTPAGKVSNESPPSLDW